MDTVAISYLQLNLIFQILEKMPSWNLSHLRAANRGIDALVAKYEKFFKGRHDLGVTVNFYVDAENPSLLKVNMNHESKEVHLHSEEALWWSTAPFKVFEHVAVRNICIDFCKEADDGMARKVIEVLKSINVSCGHMSIWGVAAEDIVEITDLVKCKGDISVSAGTSDTRAFVETLSKATKKSQMRLNKDATTAFGRTPVFHQVKDFKKNFDMGHVSPLQFHHFLMDIYDSKDSGNLDLICFKTFVPLGEAAFFQDGFPTPPLEVLWDEKTFSLEKKKVGTPKTIRKIDLETKWAVVTEDKDVDTEMTTTAAANVYLIEKNPVVLLDLLRNTGVGGDMDQQSQKEFYMATDKRKAEILKK